MKRKGFFVLALLTVVIWMGNALAQAEEEKGVGPQGTEIGSLTYYGIGAGESSTGSQNSFFGASAGRYNDASANTFVGYYAGSSNSGGSVVAMGYYAGWLNEGDNNTFLGSSSGNHNTTGHDNTFVGRLSGRSSETRSYNTFVGSYAGYSNKGSSNTYVGSHAGGQQTSDNSGWYNVFVGRSAGESNTSGWSNTFLGYGAGNHNGDGDGNVFVGTSAGSDNTEGTNNTYVGRAAGHNNETGDGNVFLGRFAGYNETGSDKLFIDNSSTDTPLIWGDFDADNVVVYGGFRAIATASASDRRWKRNIHPLQSSLKKVSALQGVSFEWNMDEFPDRGLKKGRQLGLVAQDVEKMIPELVSQDKDGYKAVSYTKLTAVLVEAVKELKAQNEKQQAEIERLRTLVEGSSEL